MPCAETLRHWYGFSEVSKDHASDSVLRPSLPPIATINLFATRANVCAYRALGPWPFTNTLQTSAKSAPSATSNCILPLQSMPALRSSQARCAIDV